MITHGSYYGDKSDVWSIGGIMLELILGGSYKDEMLLE
jgi:serine/threonine protein kinase